MAHPLSREFCRPMAGQKFIVSGRRYVLGGSLGDGAAGLVRKASGEDNREYAVKFLAPDPKYIEESAFNDVAVRFKREGERGVHLQHQNLLQIYSYCQNEDGNAFESDDPKNPFLLMEQIKGKTLESFIKKRTQKAFDITRRRLNIAIQIASALSEIHRNRLIHRDVKPANIFLVAKLQTSVIPTIKLGDFGIVKWGDFHSSLTTGVLTATNQKGLGTMKYMAPEQAIAPRDVTVRADIFSLGITLYELFSGQILATPCHVFEIINARQARGTTYSRYMTLGFHLQEPDERIAEVLLDMMRRGVTQRPSIQQVLENFETEYEKRYDIDWESDLAESQEEGRPGDSWDDD